MNEQWETQLQQRLEQQLSGLNQDLERVWWKEPSQVRARGVQLTMNRVWLTLLVVVVVVVSLCVGTTLYQQSIDYYPPPEPFPTVEQTTLEPSPSGSASPSPTPGISQSPGGRDGVPVAALLTPSDIGAGFIVSQADSAGPYRIRPVLDSCIGTREDALSHLVDHRGRTMLGPYGANIEEEVSKFEPGWAANFMTDWRERIARCPTYSPPGGFTTLLSFVDVPELGQDAFLVRRVLPGNVDLVAWSMFLRQGDFIAFVGESHQVNIVREVAAKAAGRLCAAVC